MQEIKQRRWKALAIAYLICCVYPRALSWNLKSFSRNFYRCGFLSHNVPRSLKYHSPDGHGRHLTFHKIDRKFGICQHSTASNYNFFVSFSNCQINVCNQKKKIIWKSFQWAPLPHTINSYHILCCCWRRETSKNGEKKKTQILFLNYSFEWVRYAKFKIYTKSLTRLFFF